MGPQREAVTPGGCIQTPKKERARPRGLLLGADWLMISSRSLLSWLAHGLSSRCREGLARGLIGIGDWISSGDERWLRVGTRGVDRHVSRGPSHRPHPPPAAPFSPVDADNENSIVPLLEPCERPEDVGTLHQVGETNREADLIPPS